MNTGENVLTPDDLYSLPDLLLSKGLLPIVDNWDSFDYEYSLEDLASTF